MITTYTDMGKEELRAACRAAGISYGKLNNDGMRDALFTKLADTPVEDDTPVSAAGANVFAAMVNPVAAPAAQTPATVVRDGKVVDPDAPQVDDETDKVFAYTNRCPLCDAVPQNQTWANEGVSCMCHDCGKTYSVTTGREVRAGYTRDNVNKGYSIEKDRPAQNGMKRPSAGTICGNTWAAFDAIRAATGMVTAADLPGVTTANGWNKNNVMCEFYAWRKFNGISGRQVRPAAPAAETK